MPWCSATDKALADLLIRALADLLGGVPFYLFLGAVFLTVRMVLQCKSGRAKETAAAATEKARQPPDVRQPSSAAPRPPVLRAADHIHDGKVHLLLAASGSVATIKIPNMVKHLSKHGRLSIRIVLTESAAHFLQGQSHEQPSLQDLSDLPNVEAIYRDADEWAAPWIRGNTILHIELRRWADLMLIAPLSANALAAMVNGFANTLLYAVVRAWDTTGCIDAPRPGIEPPRRDAEPRGDSERRGVAPKGIVVAPAMNTAMWNHPVTRKHMEVLQGEWSVEKGGWVEVLSPIEKTIACGDAGSGGMREWMEIVAVVEERLRLTSEDEARTDLTTKDEARTDLPSEDEELAGLTIHDEALTDLTTKDEALTDLPSEDESLADLTSEVEARTDEFLCE